MNRLHHALLVSLILPSAAMAEGTKLFPLMVGDRAPEIRVGQWVKGEPVKSFQRGQVYLLDFWATWCGPCRRGIPHLNDLQSQYKSELVVVGVSVWEKSAQDVAPFVAKFGQQMNYTIAVDDYPPAPADIANPTKWALDQGKMSINWMKASGRAELGIPTVFIVDRDGFVAWIGESDEELDEPLAKIIAGKWDLAAESANYRTRLEAAVKAKPTNDQLNSALRKKQWKEVIECCDKMLAVDPIGSAAIAGCKFQTLLIEMKETERALAFAREAIDHVARNSAPALGQIAYVIAEMSGAEGRKHLDLALEAANRANTLAHERRPGVLETLAQIYFLKGDLPNAVDCQTKAVRAVGGFASASMKEKLKKLQEAAGK
jgi:thiol-disulfide isomerase/thioredoxin